MLKELFTEYREIILYILMGACTTLVYFVTRFTARRFFGVLTSLVIAQFTGITFAFIVNKLVVFESHTSTFSALMREMGLFYSARIFSFFVDFLIAAIFVKIGGKFFARVLGLEKINYEKKLFKLPILKKFNKPLLLNELIWTLSGQVIILIANYVFSKLIIFS
jgi:putative flippase GtrA